MAAKANIRVVYLIRFDGERGTGELRFAMSEPLFEGGLLRAQTHYKELLQSLSQVGAIRDVEDALTAVQETNDRYAAQAPTLQSAQRSYRMAQEAFNGGTTTILNVFTAEAAVTAAEDSESEAHIAHGYPGRFVWRPGWRLGEAKSRCANAGCQGRHDHSDPLRLALSRVRSVASIGPRAARQPFAARGGNQEASVKVLLVDDHAIVRARLRRLFAAWAAYLRLRHLPNDGGIHFVPRTSFRDRLTQKEQQMNVREAKPLQNAALEKPIDLGIALNRGMQSEG
jgi:hypothetical protein